MITLFTSTFVMRLATIARSGSLTRRCSLAVLLTTTGMLLALAGSASAAPGLPITLNTANGSGKVCCGATAPNAYFDPDGIVHLNGAVTQTSQSGNLNFIGTLPLVGDRPNRVVYTIVHTYGGTYADLSIGTNGQIFLIPSSATGRQFVSLEGINYQAGNTNPVTPINLNGSNWSGNVCCGASGPGAYVTDNNGIFSVVHLQGGVTQTSSASINGSNPDLIGTLPFIPNTGTGGPPDQRTVYTVVHTFGGTYADLAITDSGQIFLIPLTGTLTQSDTRFVSLEGISFPVGFESWGINPDPNPGWSGGCCGALPEIEALEDQEGFIHLVGAVSQTVCCTPIATLPPALAPSRNLFFVVQTFGGTFADLSIGTNGVINVIPASFPKPSNLSFLSLEGITYDAPSPKFFGLRVHGVESHGATVQATLRKPRTLALVVEVVRRHRLVRVGVVHLGTHPAGQSRIHWNLRVNRRFLPAGSYEVSLRALNRKLLSVPSPPGDLTLVVLANGRVRVK